MMLKVDQNESDCVKSLCGKCECVLTFSMVSRVLLSPCFSTVRYTWNRHNVTLQRVLANTLKQRLTFDPSDGVSGWRLVVHIYIYCEGYMIICTTMFTRKRKTSESDHHKCVFLSPSSHGITYFQICFGFGLFVKETLINDFVYFMLICIEVCVGSSPGSSGLQAGSACLPHGP